MGEQLGGRGGAALLLSRTGELGEYKATRLGLPAKQDELIKPENDSPGANLEAKSPFSPRRKQKSQSGDWLDCLS